MPCELHVSCSRTDQLIAGVQLPTKAGPGTRGRRNSRLISHPAKPGNRTTMGVMSAPHRAQPTGLTHTESATGVTHSDRLGPRGPDRGRAWAAAGDATQPAAMRVSRRG